MMIPDNDIMYTIIRKTIRVLITLSATGDRICSVMVL